MLNTISHKFYAWATGWRVVILLVADVLMMGYVMPLAAGILAFAANNSVLPLDWMFFYTPAKAFEMLDKYGPSGRAVYLKIELTADIIYPVIYTLFFGFLISWLFHRAYPSDSNMRNWNVAPVGAWFFDLLENIVIVALLAVYPSKPAAAALLAMLMGAVKWGFALLSLGLILVGLVKAAMNGFRNQP